MAKKKNTLIERNLTEADLMLPIKAVHVGRDRIKRNPAKSLAELPDDEQAVFIAIKTATIEVLGNCELYARGSRVNGNPSLKNSDYDVFLNKQLSTEEKAEITKLVMDKHPNAKVDFTAFKDNKCILI